MKIENWMTTRLNNGQKMISNHRELKQGQYNEFYLPSVDLRSELWVRVTDDNGNETILHLKR